MTGVGSHWTSAQARALTNHVTAALEKAVVRDAVAVAEELATVVRRYGTLGLYSMCRGFAHAIKHWAAKAGPDGAQIVGMTIEVESTTPEDLPPEARASLWAARFAAAYVNHDRAMTEALFVAPYEAGRTEDAKANVVALLAMAANLIRFEFEEESCDG